MRGEVVDSKSGALIENVDIAISNLKKTFLKRTTTDENGSFRIDLPYEGIYTILCVKKQYFHSDTYQVSTVGKNQDEVIALKIPLIKAELGEYYVLRSIDFEVNSTSLQVKRGKGNIDELVLFLNDNPAILIEVGAHTDSRGNDQYNMELSTKRAKAVAEYIYSKGINKNRVSFRGYGETKLINHCKNDIFCTSENHLKNRRIEFRVISVKKQ